jgi:hypothetical protein
MSLSGLLRAATVAAPAMFIGGGAMAQQVIHVPPGMAVLLVPAPGRTAAETVRLVPAAAPTMISFDRLFAQQRAAMDHMIADMNADMNAVFAPNASPDGFLRTMFGGLDITMPRHGVSVCQESISVTYNGNDAKPLVNVSRSGNGCGPIHAGAAEPTRLAPPPASTRQLKVMEINDPAPLRAGPFHHHRT